MRATQHTLAWLGVLALGFVLAAPSQGRDEPVDRRLSYQGQVEGGSGPAQIVFRIFNASGTPIWGPEAHDVMLDADGRFVTLIGSTELDVCSRVGAILDCAAGADGIADLDQIGADDLELEVTVGGVTLSPRQKLIAAFQASKAASVDDGTVALAGLAADVLQALVPTGAVLPFGGPATSVPAGWLLCDGQLVDQATHPGLFAVIGTATGSTGTMFYVPDLRGGFIRGVDSGTGRDPDAASRTAFRAGGNVGDSVGSWQNHQFQTHSHGISNHLHTLGTDSHSHDVISTGSGGGSLRLNDDGANSGKASVDSSNISGNIGDIRTSTDPPHGHSIQSNSGTVQAPNSGLFGAESRPENVYVNFIIRCGPADAC